MFIRRSVTPTPADPLLAAYLAAYASGDGHAAAAVARAMLKS